MSIDAAVFDLDGVVTFTARVHMAAWKDVFDAFLRSWARRTGEPFRPFTEADYRAYVDGRPRYDGVQAFLASRGISLPEGTPADPPEAETVAGLGNRKNLRFRERLREQGVDVDGAAVRFIRELRGRGVRVGVASSSKNTATILETAGLEDLFEACVDGVVSERWGLRGKPAPDIFLACLELLGAPDPPRAMVAEDAVAGVEAGRAGGFGLVLGVDRGGLAIALREHGADWVIRDFREISADRVEAYFENRRHARPNALACWPELAAALRDRRLAVFLDFDAAVARDTAGREGTECTGGPEAAAPSPEMRDTLRRLAAAWPTTIVASGRDRADLAARIGVDGIEYAEDRALSGLLDAVGRSAPDVCPIYVGGGTGEDAFRAVAGRGIGILVAALPQPTAARYSLQDATEVREFLGRLAALGEATR